MATAKEEDNTKAFDVVEPKEAKLNIGSKPMVIGHKSAADSTLKNDNPEDSESKETTQEAETAPSKKVRIEPLAEQVAEEGSSEENKESNSGDEPSESVEEKSSKESEPTEKTPTKEEKSGDSEQAEKSDRDFAAEAENEEQSAQDAEAEREEKVDELRKSKKYHVNVKEKHDTAFGKIIALVVAIFISIIGVYALADADIIPGGELLPMRFIGSEAENDVKTEEVNTTNGVENEQMDTSEQQETNAEFAEVEELDFSVTEVDQNTNLVSFTNPSMSFEYPRSFGDMVKGEAGLPGKMYLYFEDNSDYFITLNTVGRVGPSGHDSPTLNLQTYTLDPTVIQYLEPDTTELRADENAEILVQEDTYVIFSTAGISFVFAGISNLPDTQNEIYQSIVFDYAQGADEAFTAQDEPVQQLQAILETLTYEVQ